MKRFFAVCLSLGIALGANAQSTEELAETARSFTRQGDYANAILVLNRALSKTPNDITLQRELAMNHYLQGDLQKAREIIVPLTDRTDVDVPSFQIAFNVLSTLKEQKELEKVFRKALKKFPDDGVVNSEYGAYLYAIKNPTAIRYWEKGMEKSPNYPMNYYQAAKHYLLTEETAKGLIYGEIFVNLESYSARTAEMKKLLLEGYKKLFAETDLTKIPSKSAFTNAVLKALQPQTGLAIHGINAESLSMIRTRFILQWFSEGGNKYPFRLFEYLRQLLREGLFEAYNQWLFGAAENPGRYQQWVNTHAAENESFMKFQRGRVFKVPTGEFYP